jgi:subtilase family serine protease
MASLPTLRELRANTRGEDTLTRLLAVLTSTTALATVLALNPALASAKNEKAVCGPAAAGEARCLSHVVTDANGKPVVTPTPAGYGPSDLLSAYNLDSSGGSGQTIAIVDAYDDPRAESDLAVYRQQYGLGTCSTTNGCFHKVNQSGGTTMPRANTGWAQEISLDLDMASAICPNCKILLVEASTNSLANLGTAVNTAATLGATVISNSYGGPEFSGETSSESAYNHAGIPITVSSGDSGYGPQFPAASRYVTAVGGTTLSHSGSAWSETAWSGAGSGCSSYIVKPDWQKDPRCGMRTIADVSAVADPNTGVAVYDTYRSGGWLVFGGTSVSSPIIAGVYALAGNGALITYGSYPYSLPSALNDIKSGSNGSCGGSYLCTAVKGYDGPTGLGTPNTAAAF